MSSVGPAHRAAKSAESTSAGRILVADPDKGIARTLAAVLTTDNLETEFVCSVYDAARKLRAEVWDLLIADMGLGTGDTTLVQRARELSPRTLVLVTTGVGSLESALAAMRSGAFGYLVKPVDVEEMRLTVKRGLDFRKLEFELAQRVRQLEAAEAHARHLAGELQDRVAAATAELRTRLEELDAANVQLVQTQEDHDRFVAMVAHEMRGPLNPIISYAQLAKRPNTSGEQLTRYMDIIVDHGFRLNRMVDDLQTATRLRTGHFALQRMQVDVVEEVKQIVEQFQTATPGRVFRLNLPAQAVLAWVDKDRIIQAVRNLLDNAVKYSAEGGAVEVSVGSESGTLRIDVRDYGAGIPESEMDHIFEAFTRLGKRTEVTGSGLGLFITRGIVSAHGGELTVANGSGPERARGAIFTISIPTSAGLVAGEK